MPPIWGRTTFYNGIRMRSRLEATFAAWLDEQQLAWRYEPHAFATVAGQYLPDFLVEHNGARVYIEIKPTLAHITDAVAANGDIIRASRPDARFVVVIPAGSLWHIATGDTLTPDLIDQIQGTQPSPPTPAVTRHELRGEIVWFPRNDEIGLLIAYIADRAAIEALIPATLIPTLFDDPLNALAFATISTGAPIDDERVTELLQQLEEAEPLGNPVDTVAAFVRDAAVRARRSTIAPAETVDALAGIHEPDTQQASIATVVAWLEAQQ